MKSFDVEHLLDTVSFVLAEAHQDGATTRP
jgi:hypothetical protein